MWRAVGVVALVAGLAVVALGLWTEVGMAKVAEPPFKTIRTDGDFSVRAYEPMIVASVRVSGARGEAANAGFRPLANYIFGGNQPTKKIEMTAPVVQEPAGEKIAMTAPVIQEPAGGDEWTVRFVMPAEFTMDTLPKPDNADVTLSEVPKETVAVVRFSGINTEGALNKQTARLRDWIAKEGLTPKGTPRFAFYDPPWTLPFLRRNEVMIPIAP